MSAESTLPSPTDRVQIRDFALHLQLGVTPEERSYPQRVLLSAELGLDTRQAARTLKLADTVDYSQLAKDYRALAESRQWVLIEELLESLAADTLERCARVSFVRLLLKKFTVPGTAYVAIEITRAR